MVQISGDLPKGHNFRLIEDFALLLQVGIRIDLVRSAKTQNRMLLTDRGHAYQSEDGIPFAEENIYHYSTVKFFCKLAVPCSVQELRLVASNFNRSFCVCREKLPPEILGTYFTRKVCGLDLGTLRQEISNSTLVILPHFYTGRKEPIVDS